MKISLRLKAILLILLITVSLGGAAVFISSQSNGNIIDTQYKTMATDTANTVAVSLDPKEVRKLRDAVMSIYRNTENKVGSEEWGSPEFDEYIARFTSVSEMPEFDSVREDMAKIQNVINVDCIYLIYVDVDTKSAVYLVDADPEEPCPPGCFDPVYEVNYACLTDPTLGFPAYITNTEEYGWLLTTGTPVYDGDEVIAYASVDISMEEIRKVQRYNVIELLILLLIGMFVICCLCILLVDSFVVKPINELSGVAEKYWDSSAPGVKNDFSKLKISSNDEIGVLSDSMKKMEEDINAYFLSLDSTRQELYYVKEESDNMRRLANKDALTGIRNKTAYDVEIRNVENDAKRKGIPFGLVMVDLNYLKVINDTYGHDKGNVVIKNTSDLVCETFKHSPVFRIGGDEFVVIIRNHDLENVDDLIKEFKTSTDMLSSDKSLRKWERISAAIGYAVFTEEDTNADDVFKRADSAMYEDKKNMKAARE